MPFPTTHDVTHRPSKPVRYQSLDLLRGIAILGTLGTNIWIFTDPEGLVGYVLRSSEAAVPAIWSGVATVLQQIAQGKFLGLLTLMFGIGLEIQRRSAQRANRPWPGRYAWRAGLLLLDGALHFLLITEFDVLMGYAITGVIVAYLLLTSERIQRRWIILRSTILLVLLTLIAVGLALMPALGEWGDGEPTHPTVAQPVRQRQLHRPDRVPSRQPRDVPARAGVHHLSVHSDVPARCPARPARCAGRQRPAARTPDASGCRRTRR